MKKEKTLPPFLLSKVPPFFLLLTLNIFKIDILYTLMLSVLLSTILFWCFLDKKLQTINVGATNTVLPIVNTSADVAYGTVIEATAGFGVITELNSTFPGRPLSSLYFAVAALAEVIGTASCGLAIAMETLADTYLALDGDPEEFTPDCDISF